MEENNSFGFDDSPVLYKPIKKFKHCRRLDENNINLEDMHKRLIMYLTKKREIPKNELKLYLEQAKKINPRNIKNRWILMKIRGLLSYILKKRSDFQCSIVNGEITIFDRSASQHEMAVSEIPEIPLFFSQPESDILKFPTGILTNDNFITVESKNNITKMECEVDYSQDLFASIGSLHTFSQENYKILKHITNDNTKISSDDSVFKLPPTVSEKIEQVYKIHDVVEENYNSFLSTFCESCTPDGLEENIQNDIKPTELYNKDNFLDNLSMTNEELKTNFDILFQETENWISGIVQQLAHLNIRENHTSCDSVSGKEDAICNLNESMTSSNSLHINTHHSVENLRIIREVCFEFKKNLEKKMQNDKKLEILKELLQSSNLS